MVNETKVPSRNAFIDNLCALKSAKESKNDKKTLFGVSPRIADLNGTFMWFSRLSSY